MDKETVILAPVDYDVFDLIEEALSMLPSYAVAIAYIDYEDTWRPIAKSKAGNYYTKQRWKPLFGFKLRLLTNILYKYTSHIKHKYCEWVAYLITRKREIFVCCVYQPQRDIYIIYPKAQVILKKAEDK